MPSKGVRRVAGSALLLLAALACQDTPSPFDASVGVPDSVSAEPVDLTTIRVMWTPVPGAASYVLQRRTNFSGPFTTVDDQIPVSQNSFLDTGLVPETFYGYRLRVRTSLGELSGPSSVSGSRTPPVPGILAQVSTSSSGTSVDPDGYQLVVQGASDSVQLPLDVNGERRVSPLPPGTYAVALGGLSSNCTADSLLRTRVVTDQGINTLQKVNFNVVCLNPTEGNILVALVVSGDSLDANGYQFTITGIPEDTTLAPVIRTANVPDPLGTPGLLFEGLPRGDYQVELKDVAGNCTVTGGATIREVQVTGLTTSPVGYLLDCPASGTSDRPFVFRNTWIPAAAGSGSAVELEIVLDLTADPNQTVGAVQAELAYDAQVLRYDSILPDRLPNIVDNGATPGRVAWGAFTGSALGRSGSVRVARLFFTVIGAAGQTARTQSINVQAGSSSGTGSLRFDGLIRVAEATFTVGSGTSNQAPIANANGPYAGVTGAPISFTASGSSDPDGSIVSYAWTFGDGGTATGAAPSHTYVSAGSFTATLTVTDNQGATGQSQAGVTISGGGGGNLPPVAAANGPYSGAAGSPIGFSAAGSSDPDGSVVSYAWNFGDGGTGAGSTASHTYSAAGSYTAVLTVTDNQGGTDTDQAAVTVTGPSPTPFTWTGTFGSINPSDSIVTLTITLDLSSDIPDTPGSEALQTWAVDSLKWNPAVLKYFSFNFGPGGFGSVDPTFAVSQGRLVFNGAQPANHSTGLMTLATIRFKVIGSGGSATTTSTALGNLIGTAATGGFNYRSKTSIQEAGISAP